MLVETIPEVKQEEYSQYLLRESREIVLRSAPFALPHEPTKIWIVDDINKNFTSGHVEGSAAYNGQLNGVHYYELEKGNEPYQKALDLLSTVHEGAHQKHAELIGQRIWQNGETPDDVASQYPEMTPKQIFEYIDLKADPNPNFTDTLTEGFAILVERLTFERIFRDGIVDEGPFLQLLTDYHNEQWPNLICPIEGGGHHNSGYRLVLNLVDKLGLEGFVSWFESLDYEFCNKIKRGSKSYKEFVLHPLALPRLSRVRAFPTEVIRK